MRQQIIAAISAALLQFAAGAAYSADLQGHCCADLQERIAELEATTARKGNRKVSLTLSGKVSQALLFWDDGLEKNVYVFGNRNYQSKFNFTGNAPITTDQSTGFDVTLRLRDTLSDEVNQLDDDAEFVSEGSTGVSFSAGNSNGLRFPSFPSCSSIISVGICTLSGLGSGG